MIHLHTMTWYMLYIIRYIPHLFADMLAPFATRPLYERKEDRVDNLLNLEGKEERMKRT